MTPKAQIVKDICDSIAYDFPEQILIDLVQDEVEDLFRNYSEDQTTRDAVGAAAYKVSILKEVYNPQFQKDIEILDKLYVALEEWRNEIEQRNKILKLPPES